MRSTAKFALALIALGALLGCGPSSSSQDQAAKEKSIDKYAQSHGASDKVRR